MLTIKRVNPTTVLADPAIHEAVKHLASIGIEFRCDEGLCNAVSAAELVGEANGRAAMATLGAMSITLNHD